MSEEEKPFRIQERTFYFAVDLVKLVKTLPRDLAGQVITKQLIWAGTSIGANVEEADAAESKADFLHKMGIAHKEAREACYWIKLLLAAYPHLQDQLSPLADEGEQLKRIIGAIIRKRKSNP